ncbi:MAG: permease [Flavobacteriaceae bacterium]|nr:permease [Flavobacteriaceae bacterium]|tara:strand:+ start:6940 stop:8217 length:1278 start_codon:yes stop_codon:yes gene_type:complete
MNIWKISWANIKSKPLYSILSVLMLSLSIALLLGIQQIKTSFEYQMENNLGDISMVIGAKGSPLQLVLASVLHLDNPTGNINYGEAKKVTKTPLIKKAIPISYGDNYKGYRIVGTVEGFTDIYKAEYAEGKPFEHSMEVVLGASVAQLLDLKIGDTFQSSHGLVENQVEVHDDEFKVVGILAPTQKVVDRLIITNLESIWDVHDHDHDEDSKDHKHNDHDEHEHDHDHDHDHEHKEKEVIDYDEKSITSMLVSFRSPTAVLSLPRSINEKTNMQAALPKYELDRLYQFTGVGLDTITWIAYVILVISGLIIFISLYKMVKDRAFDLALLRTYGASNGQLIKMVTYEGLVIVVGGFILGLTITKAGLYLLLRIFENSKRQSIIMDLSLTEMLNVIGLVLVMIVLSIALAIYPIIKMNISTILSNEK